MTRHERNAQEVQPLRQFLLVLRSYLTGFREDSHAARISFPAIFGIEVSGNFPPNAWRVFALFRKGVFGGVFANRKSTKRWGRNASWVATLAKTQAGTRLSVTGDVPAAWRSASGAGWMGTVAGGAQGTAQLTCA